MEDLFLLSGEETEDDDSEEEAQEGEGAAKDDDGAVEDDDGEEEAQEAKGVVAQRPLDLADVARLYGTAAIERHKQKQEHEPSLSVCVVFLARSLNSWKCEVKCQSKYKRE